MNRVNRTKVSSISNATNRSNQDTLDGSQPLRDAAIIVWLVLGIVGVLFNVTETSIILRKLNRMTPFGLILLSLCMADILSSLLFAIYAVITIAGHRDSSQVIQLTYRLIFACTAVSFIHIVLIALQRLCAVAFPHAFTRIVNLTKCSVILLNGWLVAFLYGVIYAFDDAAIEVSCYQVFIVGIVLIIIYLNISYRARLKNVHKRSTHSRSNHTKRIFFHSFAVTAAFIACNYPYAIAFLFYPNFKTYETFSMA